MTSEMIIRFNGNARRVIVIRVDAGRRARMARTLGRMGWHPSVIRRVCRLSAATVRQALAGGGASLWGRHLATIQAELTRVVQ